MCDPVSMATVQQMQSTLFLGNETNKATNEFNKNLATNYLASMVQTQEQRRQIGEQAQQQQSEIARKAQQERARLAVLALESGSGGNTAARVQTTAAMDTDAALSMSERNLLGAMDQSQRQAEGLRRQTIANFRQGVTWDGLNLQIQGIELAGQAQNADRIAAEQAKAAANSKKPSKFGPQDSIWD